MLVPYILRFTERFLEALDARGDLVKYEFGHDGGPQLEQDPYPGGGSLVVLKVPNPDRPDNLYHMFLERTPTIVAFTIEDQTVSIVDLL
jgi:hypothetical protein